MSSELAQLWEGAGGQVPPDADVVPFESLLAGPKAIAVGVMYPGEHADDGVPLIKVGDIKGGRIPAEPEFKVSQAVNTEYQRTQLRGDELLITLVGEPGACVVATPAMKGWNPARAIAVARLKDPSLRTYVKAVLESRPGKHLIDSVLNTTVQKTLNLKDIRQLPVPLPARCVVDGVSQVVDALDDRITLLRETNATLEAIAQALFKSWFVDFDPVRAKRDGLAPEGMDEVTAALFPDSFEDSELGEAPSGWEVCCIEQVADRIGMGPFGSNIKVETFVDQGVPVLNGSNVQGAIVEDGGFRFITPEHALRLRNSCVQAGDIVITHRGTLGQVAIVPSRSQYPEYVCSQSQFFLRCDSRVMQPEWMLYFLRSAAGQHLLLSNAAQVGVPSIARPTSHLRSMRLLVPPPDLVRQYANVVGPLHESVVSKREHITVLSSLRDTLLPRLISGQLRLPEAAYAVESELA